ncbi:MAG: hypothetical protein ACOCSE_04190 [Chitinivibrionales bacterium]
MRRVVLIFSVLILCFDASGKRCIFFGVVQGSAPSIEKRLERELRNRLYQSEILNMVGKEKTDIISYQGGFSDNEEVLFDLKGKIQRAAGSNTVAVWARVKKFRITPERKYLIRSVAAGELVMEFVVYDLRADTRVFTGEIAVVDEKKMGFVFFRDVKKIAHVGVGNRTEVMEGLIQEVSERFFNVTEAIVTGNMNSVSEDEEIQEVDLSGVDEIFNIPGVEGQSIEEEELGE